MPRQYRLKGNDIRLLTRPRVPHQKKTENTNMAQQRNCRGIDDFCRLCAVESQSGVIIYSSEGENLSLEKMIANCLRIEVSRDDVLPKRVCQSCKLLLEGYCRFSERATQVQQTLYILLGLQLPHPHNQGSQLYIIDNTVKVESNIIKKEIDEFFTSETNIQIDRERFEVFHADDRSIERDDRRKQCCNKKPGKNQESIYTNEFITNVNENAGSSEKHKLKQINGKKLLVVNKSLHKLLESDKSIETELSNKNGNECENSGERLESYKKDDLLGLSQETFEVDIKNREEENRDNEEVNIKMETEWKKHWGIMCDECKSVLQDRLQFDKHYICCHNKNPVYTCSYCKKTFDKHSCFKLHIVEHIYSGKFKCRYCRKKFCTKEILEIHLTLYHGQVKIHICQECGRTFTSQSRLEFHLKKHKNAKNEEHECTECGKILHSRGGFAAHKSVHKLGRHFMCHICGKTFTQKINMQQHVKHHKGEKPHSCDICEKSFAEKSYLNRHKSFHTKDRLFQCPVCRKRYKTERCLKVHSQTHWNLRPYVCSICGKGFLSSTKLKQHHNCHTGERPFACKHCEKTFTNYPNLLKHTRRRHKVDHKTGVSLKEECKSQIMVPSTVVNQMGQQHFEISKSAIEVEVKEDGNDGSTSRPSDTRTLMETSATCFSHFEPVHQENCGYQMNLLPDIMYSDPNEIYLT